MSPGGSSFHILSQVGHAVYWCGLIHTQCLWLIILFSFQTFACLEERATHRSIEAAALVIFSATLSCSIDRETTASLWKWGWHPKIWDRILSLLKAGQRFILCPADSVLTIKLSTFHLKVIPFAIPIIFCYRLLWCHSLLSIAKITLNYVFELSMGIQWGL